MTTVARADLVDPPELTPDEAGGASTRASVYTLTAPASAADPLMMQAPDGTTFNWKPTELVYRDKSGLMDYIVGSSPAALSTFGKQARYDRVFPNGHDTFLATADGVKHWTFLNEPPRTPADYLADGVEFGVSGLVSGIPLPTGEYVVMEAGPFSFPEPIIKDQSGREIHGRYEIVDTDGGQQLFIWFDAAFLTDAVYPVAIDPTVVVSAGYSTAGNNARKGVILSNGWIVAGANDIPGSRLYFYVSKDGGTTFTQLCYRAFKLDAGFAMAAIGTMVYVHAAATGSTSSALYRFDATTVTNGDIGGAYSTPVSGVIAFSDSNSPTLTIDGGVFHAAASVKISARPSSFNIQYSKSTDALSWTQTQITSFDSLYANAFAPSVVVKNGNSVVFYGVANTEGTASNSVECAVWNGSSWTLRVSIEGFTGTKGWPSAALDPTTGRFHCAWHGKDGVAGDTAVNNIRHSSSLDALSWPTGTKLTSGNVDTQENPSIAFGDGKVHVLWSGIVPASGVTFKRLRRIFYSGSTWSSIANLTTNTAADANHVSTTLTNTAALRYVYTEGATVKFDSIMFNTPPLAPSELTRSNFDANKTARFSWQHNDTPGDAASSYDLEIYETATGLRKVFIDRYGTNPTEFYLVAGTHSLVNGGTYQWRVRTYDSAGAQSPWSAYTTFKCSAGPTVNVTSPAANAAISSESYTFTGYYEQPNGVPQKSFRFRLYSSAGVLLQDSGEIIGTANAKTFSGLTNNTSYKIEFTATSQDDVSTTSAQVSFTVAYTPPVAPVVKIYNDAKQARIIVSIQNPSPGAEQPAVVFNTIYRRKIGDQEWRMIATNVTTSEYSDYTCPAGMFEYSVTASSAAGTSSERTTMQVTSSFNGQWLIDETEPTNNVNFLYNNTGAQAAGRGQVDYTVTFRRYPRERNGPAQYKSGMLSASLLPNGRTVREQIEQLDAMRLSNRTFLLKFVDGGIHRVRFRPPEEGTRYGGAIGQISIEWTEVDEV